MVAQETRLLDQGWYFHLGAAKKYYSGFPDKARTGRNLGIWNSFVTGNHWEPVRLPHDWCAYLPYDPMLSFWCGYKERGEGWYYTTLQLGADAIENARLVFEGVLGQSEVYVNGILVGRNFSGYNRFVCDVSAQLIPNGENSIAVRVDATEWEAWSYEGAGIYRPVWLELRHRQQLDTDHCFVRGQKQENNWVVLADIPTLGCEKDAEVVVSLYDTHGKSVAEAEMAADEVCRFAVPVANAMEWSPEEPVLYRFAAELVKDGCVLDRFEAPVGLREIRWDPERGMMLNGQVYPIKGICCHQDHGGVGAAVSPELMEYRIAQLKKLGINAYRCAHHAAPEALFAICDRLGMLVMAENRHFATSPEALAQMESLVLVARNHPSVFLYSMFNEEVYTQGNYLGYRIAGKLRDTIRALDDTRAVTGAMNEGIVDGPNAADAMDVVGVNYCNREYDRIRARYPEKVLLGSENCPTLATRGVYKTVPERVFNSYGDHWAGFSVSITETMQTVAAADYCAGCFPWSGFDSYGEPAPLQWPSVMSHWGFHDICGYPKDTAYFLSAWYRTELMAHLLPHWNWKDGEQVRVCVFTNGEEAELFVNGQSAGVQPVCDRKAQWNVTYCPGTVRVRVSRGEEEVWDQVQTAHAPARILLEDVTPAVEKPVCRIINICVTDEAGTPVPEYGETVSFAGEHLTVLGVSNGNPNGTQPNVASEVPLFNGRAQLIATADSGQIRVRCGALPEAVI